MKNKSRMLTLCASYDRNRKPYPKVLLKGIWFRNWGFNPGDQITVTSPGSCTLVITRSKTAAQMNRARLVKATKKMFMTIDSFSDENASLDEFESPFFATLKRKGERLQ
jgi:hypothetical protein